MENEFDIGLGNITCIVSEKMQKLVDYRDNFKYETPHKKPFLFDFTYFGNQDCPHVLNNEALEIVKDKIEKFESVIILLKVNNRNKRGLDNLIESISKILNNKSAVLFLCNPFDGLHTHETTQNNKMLIACVNPSNRHIWYKAKGTQPIACFLFEGKYFLDSRNYIITKNAYKIEKV